MKNAFTGPIAWMAQNHVAANLLMFILLAGGLIMIATSVRQEVFPDFEVDMVVINVPYPGASPAEVESGIILAVEEALEGIDGIKEVTSVAIEGLATIQAELFFDADKPQVASDIQNAVDRISTLPDDAEDPMVEIPSTDHEVLQLVLYGDASENTLKELAEGIRDDLLEEEDISKVELANTRPREISIEIPQQMLRTYGLTIEEVATIIRATAVELPAGELKTKAGKVLLRTMERRDWAPEFADITIVGTSAGSQVKLGDIARISEGFEDVEQFAFFNAQRAVRAAARRATPRRRAQGALQ